MTFAAKGCLPASRFRGLRPWSCVGRGMDAVSLDVIATEITADPPAVYFQIRVQEGFALLPAQNPKQKP